MDINDIFEQIKTKEGREKYQEDTKREIKEVMEKREKHGIYSTNVIKKSN